MCMYFIFVHKSGTRILMSPNIAPFSFLFEESSESRLGILNKITLVKADLLVRIVREVCIGFWTQI
jgi:hypothetical protein